MLSNLGPDGVMICSKRGGALKSSGVTYTLIPPIRLHYCTSLPYPK